jgi:hypothetical protein
MKGTQEMEGSKRGRFLEAEENYRKLAEKIAPFVVRRRFEEFSTAGRWRAGSAHTQEHVANYASASLERTMARRTYVVNGIGQGRVSIRLNRGQ